MGAYMLAYRVLTPSPAEPRKTVKMRRRDILEALGPSDRPTVRMMPAVRTELLGGPVNDSDV